MVWPVHNSPFSLRSPGCLEGCKMVDRGQSKKTERPCVEYLINRFESETENFCGGSNSTASSSSLAADADSSLGCSRVYPEKKLVWLTSWDLTSLNNNLMSSLFSQLLFNFRHVLHEKLNTTLLSSDTLYCLPQCVVDTSSSSWRFEETWQFYFKKMKFSTKRNWWVPIDFQDI